LIFFCGDAQGNLQMELLKKFWIVFDKINDVLMIFSSVIVLVTTLGISADIISRYAFSKSFTGAIELTEFGLLWMTFLGIAWVWRRDTHVRIDILFNRLKPKQKTISNIVIALFGIVIFGLLTWFGTKVTIKDFISHAIIESVLKPPKWPIEIIIPFGSLLLLLESIKKLLNYAAVLKSKTF
jgi:C4-dicarboxylate transporter DctQ subunit